MKLRVIANFNNPENPTEVEQRELYFDDFLCNISASEYLFFDRFVKSSTFKIKNLVTIKFKDMVSYEFVDEEIQPRTSTIDTKNLAQRQ